MSAPDTNIRKQIRRHWMPILGCIVTAALGVGIIFYWLGEEIGTASDSSEAPSPTASQALEPSFGDAPILEIEPEQVNPGIDEGTGLDNGTQP